MAPCAGALQLNIRTAEFLAAELSRDPEWRARQIRESFNITSRYLRAQKPPRTLRDPPPG